jgi:hypothetical protein
MLTLEMMLWLLVFAYFGNDDVVVVGACIFK